MAAAIDKWYNKIGKGGGGNTSSYRMEPTMTIYEIRTCFMYGGGVMPGRRAGSGVGKYNAQSPKQAAKVSTLLRRGPI